MEVVMNRIVNGLIVFAIITCGSGISASAQVDPCKWWATGVVQPFPAGYSSATCFYAIYSFNSYACYSYSCPPPAAKIETCPTCPHGGSPISLVSGNTFIEENDVNVPGLSNGLKLTRIWISKWPSTQTAFQTGLFGLNWRSTYEERIFMGSDNYVKYARSDGSFWSFGGAGSLYLEVIS
jgi:hypothetical protein